MRPSSRPPRTLSKLSDSVHHQLSMYALAASAAGVGMLMLTQPAEAKIVYTTAHHVLGHGHVKYLLDLNHDGVTDFLLTHTSARSTFGSVAGVFVSPGPRYQSNGVRGSSKWPEFYASALRAGTPIGPSQRFLHRELVMAQKGWSADWFYFGRWANNGQGVRNRYLGLKFAIKGKIHYGWARLSVTLGNGTDVVTATLTGYAFETIANKSIIAGKTKGPDVTTVRPASLGHLAAGASAIPAWRVKRTAATTH